MQTGKDKWVGCVKSRLARLLVFALVSCAAVVSGCDRRTHEVHITPEGQKLKRDVSDGLARGFAGSVSYQRFATRMGEAYLYVERFGTRRIVDEVDRLARMERAGSQLTDLLIGWFEAELGEDTRFRDFRRRMDEDLREDMHNLARYCWAGLILSRHGGDPSEEMMIRILLYFVERGYFTLEDLPLLVRAVAEEDTDRLMPFVQRLVARGMGVPEEARIPPSLAFLSDAESARVSLEGYIRTTEAYREKLREWENQRKTDPDAERPDPLEVPAELVFGLIEFDFEININLFGGPHVLRVKLVCSVEPLETNGRWDAEAGHVVWEGLMNGGQPENLLCYAWWSAPDAEFQARHFGSVVLDGSRLGEYVIWRKSFTEQEGEEWDAFLSDLRPGEALREKIKAFQFTDSPDLADIPRDLILAGVEEEDGSGVSEQGGQ